MSMFSTFKINNDQTILQKLYNMGWGLVLLIIIMACVGFVALYSAAGGNIDPWASKQMMRFGVGLIVMFIIALMDIKIWYRLTYPIYIGGFILLVIVETMGRIGMGAQRWIDLGFIQLQPSEFMKIAVVMVLARYFHTATQVEMKSIKFLIPAVILIAAPSALVMVQPDLGAALMIIIVGVAMIFLSGAPLWIFYGGAALVAAAIPIGWQFMHEFQRQRVIVFLNPESDPLGSGYHIIQSKIALGSGGIEGKGFMKGTQSHLNFLPEKQTDFIFTLWAEEWGLIGGVGLLFLFSLIFLYGIIIALNCRHSFGRLLAMGLIVNFSIYIFINISMVMGLIPVVGEPLPMISYGGTSMLAALVAFGLILSCNIHRNSKLPKMQ